MFLDSVTLARCVDMLVLCFILACLSWPAWRQQEILGKVPSKDTRIVWCSFISGNGQPTSWSVPNNITERVSRWIQVTLNPSQLLMFGCQLFALLRPSAPWPFMLSDALVCRGYFWSASQAGFSSHLRDVDWIGNGDAFDEDRTYLSWMGLCCACIFSSVSSGLQWWDNTFKWKTCLVPMICLLCMIILALLMGMIPSWLGCWACNSESLLPKMVRLLCRDLELVLYSR